MGEEENYFGLLVAAAYRHLPVTPKNSKAVRDVARAVLANVLASDYLNRWNEAADTDPQAGTDLLCEAEALLDKISDTGKKLALTHYAQGLIYRGRHRPAEALAAFQRAIQCDPTFARAYAQMGSQLINLAKSEDQLDEALKKLNEAIKLSPNDPSVGTFYWNQGRAYFFKEKELDKAIKALEQAVRHRPNLWHNWLYLVSAYALRDNPGDVETAKKKLEKFRKENKVPGSTNYQKIEDVENLGKVNDSTSAVVQQGRKKFLEGLKKVW